MLMSSDETALTHDVLEWCHLYANHASVIHKNINFNLSFKCVCVGGDENYENFKAFLEC